MTYYGGSVANDKPNSNSLNWCGYCESDKIAYLNSQFGGGVEGSLCLTIEYAWIHDSYVARASLRVAS